LFQQYSNCLKNYPHFQNLTLVLFSLLLQLLFIIYCLFSFRIFHQLRNNFFELLLNDYYDCYITLRYLILKIQLLFLLGFGFEKIFNAHMQTFIPELPLVLWKIIFLFLDFHTFIKLCCLVLSNSVEKRIYLFVSYSILL